MTIAARTGWMEPLSGFFHLFNWTFDGLSAGYGGSPRGSSEFRWSKLAVYGGVIAFGLVSSGKRHWAAIPQLDLGYLITVVQCPAAPPLARTDEVNRRAGELALQVPGVAHVVNIVGFSEATFTTAAELGADFHDFPTVEERAKDPAKSAEAIQAALSAKLSSIQEGLVIVVRPPPVRGIGTAGGFRMMIEDRAARVRSELQKRSRQ